MSLTPSDQNLFQGNKYSLTFVRLPYIQFFIQDINIPGIITNPPEQETPFITAPLPANKMKYEPFSMTFLVDEMLYSWTTVADWLKGLTIPESFEQYKTLTMQQRIQMSTSQPQYSDALLTIMTNKNNPVMQIMFTKMFPISLTGIPLSVKDTPTDVKTATAEFGFTNWDINRQV